jgi:2'-5' RNA ligase superfamily/Aminoglycoside-2''-adenylyltransferase
MDAPSIQRSIQPARRQPSLLYRITGRLNVLVWRAPLPRRVLARVSATVYRNPPMPAEEVLAILAALQAAGASCWISGGWGVDALVGERTRTHRDLDLVVEDRDMQRAIEALESLGYREWYRADSEVPLFSRIVFHDNQLAGRAVDLHPLQLSGTQVQFTSGEIEGRTVPCLSMDVQLKTHSSYRKRWRDRADLARLRKLREGSATTLIVPVPTADGLLQKSAREAGLPAHITILYPFLNARSIDAETESTLTSLFAQVPSFDFTLPEVGRFPGVVYLSPEPAAAFVALTQALAERWPDHQPYGGSFQEIIPHLTVAYGAPIPNGLAERLPLTARAEEVWLMSRSAGRWVRRRSFPLAR